MLDHFYYSPEILKYNFGPGHPLQPERLRRTMQLLGRYGVEPIDPGLCASEDLLRVHDPEYVEGVRAISNATYDGKPYLLGFGAGDNPAFPGMFEAASAYCAATAQAARSVRDGAPLAFSIGGGLHHAARGRASGFCIFNDPAIACSILRERFERVAYVDIDVHHGDGVQWIFYDDPTVLTCSIHEDGRTLFPGTGGTEETGAEFSSFNVPIEAWTSGDVWLDAFMQTVPAAVEAFGAQAVVLQMGTDAHYLDPLAHICCVQQDWLGAVKAVAGWGLPTVAIGGGGYDMTTVPRMWTSACLTLGGVEFDDELPADLATEWHVPTYSDREAPNRGIGKGHAARVVADLCGRNVPELRKRR